MRSLHTATRESPSRATKTQHSQKYLFFFFKREHHVSEAIYWTWSSFDLMAVEVQKHMAIMIRTIVSFGDHEKAPPLTHTYFCVQAVFIMFSCLKHWVSGQG